MILSTFIQIRAFISVTRFGETLAKNVSLRQLFEGLIIILQNFEPALPIIFLILGKLSLL